MLTRKNSLDEKRPFADSAGLFGGLDAPSAMKLAMVAGDVALVIDGQGTIVDASFDETEFPEFAQWVGGNWLDTVTTESRPKIMEMLAGARKGETQHWRQVNHPTREGDVPVKYVVVGLNGGDRHIAFGRDLREAGKAQQRLLQVQQSLERDYLRLRQLEARYRLLFEQSREPVLVVEAAGYRIREANAAAHSLLKVRQGSLIDKKLQGLFKNAAREKVTAQIGAALSATDVAPIQAALEKGGHEVSVTASGFSQDRKQFVLVRLTDDQAADSGSERALGDIIEEMPDAFVLTDEELRIAAANRAFVELASAASADQLIGRDLADFVGRPGIDLDLIVSQVDKDGAARSVSTIVRDLTGAGEEPVELSAVSTHGEDRLFGFVIRATGRRLRDLPPGSHEPPRSVEQLTDLVGRMPLKDIVRESTDLIERLCIEAALLYTSDNRASAAEILGLSRQSLYSKLHRYGLGNLPAEPE